MATSSDCVTGFTTLSDGTVVGGTAGGNLVLVTANGIRAIKTGGTGPVTGLMVFAASPEANGPQLVSYVVGEGIGIFDPHSATNLSFGINHPLVDYEGTPLTDPTGVVTDHRFFVMQPVPGRPHLTDARNYALTKPDGADELAFVDVQTDGELCVMYRSWYGALASGICANVSDQLLTPSRPAEAPTPLSSPTALPVTATRTP